MRSTSQLIALRSDTSSNEGTELEVNAGRLLSGLRLQFKLMARASCHALGAPSFEDIAHSEEIIWPSFDTELDAESWDLPVPKPLQIPELEATSGRWRGRALLLAWPKGVQVCDDPPLELQACEWSFSNSELNMDMHWTHLSWSLIHLHGIPCVAASQLPFTCCRLRWYSRDRRVAGPYTEPCLTFIDAPVEVVSEVLCSISSVQVKASFQIPRLSEKLSEPAAFCQWRFAAEGGEWSVLSLRSFDSSRCQELLGEDDGLRLGERYVFSVRLSDGRRSSTWSESSPVLLFDVPEAAAPVPRGGPQRLLVEPLSLTSVRCWWPQLQAPEMVSMGSLMSGRPTLEYRLDVSQGEGLERHCTVLCSDEEVEEARGSSSLSMHEILSKLLKAAKTYDHLHTLP